jgi:hypothetical protein
MFLDCREIAESLKTRASLKHEIRLEFHPQLKRLWGTNPGLSKLARTRATNWAQAHPGAA